MNHREISKEIVIVILAALILALTISIADYSLFYTALISFIIIISVNVLVKKIIAYNLDTDIKIRFWEWYQFGWKKTSHFNKPIPMIWLPIMLSYLTKGLVWWMAVLEFDVSPRTERVARRHEFYRFTDVTEWHIALIAAFGVISNLVLAVIGYLLGFESFATLNIYYATWSLIPISSLDGSKILFGSRVLWITMLVVLLTTLIWGLIIF